MEAGAVDVDHILRAGDIGSFLSLLVAEESRVPDSDDTANLRKRVATELAIASEGGAFEKGIMDMGQLTPFTWRSCSSTTWARRPSASAMWIVRAPFSTRRVSSSGARSRFTGTASGECMTVPCTNAATPRLGTARPACPAAGRRTKRAA
jgi:hypothetical protein